MNIYIIPVDKIEVDKDRQRRDLGNIEQLANSIFANGLLQPIIVARGCDDEYELVAGQRRLEAHKHLKLPKIDAILYEELSETKRIIIELEENIKRKMLTWQEEVCACLKIHDHYCALDENWNVSSTADAINLTPGHVSSMLGVARAIVSGDTNIAECETLTSATNMLSRENQRRIDDSVSAVFDEMNVKVSDEGEAFMSIKVDLSETVSADEIDSTQRTLEDFKSIRSAGRDIFQEDFFEWAKAYSGKPFQVIHLDPPYGIGHHKTKQGPAEYLGSYNDAEDVFFKFINTIFQNREKLLAHQAHIMLWFSMNYYNRTIVEIMQYHEPGAFEIRVNPFPLIWHKSDDIGIVPDGRRYGRRVYETALLIAINDRKINDIRSNLYSWPTNKRSAAHLSEKPTAVTNFFLSWIIDETRGVNFLDPCCGSGSALVSAEKLRAESIIGLDNNEDSVITARRRLNSYRLQLAGKFSESSDLTEDEMSKIGS